MKGKMKTVVMEAEGKVVVRELDIPDIQPNEVLVRMHQCNICTVDWQTFAGLRRSMGRKFPWAGGHEMAGEIVEVGEAVTNVKLGDHVAFGVSSCGKCFMCRTGHSDRCTERVGSEREINGVVGSFGFSQYAVFDSAVCYKVSKELPYEQAGFVEPVATSIHGVKRARVTAGEKVVIIGAGNLGLVNAQVAKAYGGDVLVSEIMPERREKAEKLGFPTVDPTADNFKAVINDFTEGRGADVVILSVGKTPANNQAIEILSVRGRALFFAAGHPVPELNIGSNDIHYKEYELIGTYNSDPSDFLLSAKFLSDGTVKVDQIMSQKVPMDECQRAFELAATPGTYRVSVTLD